MNTVDAIFIIFIILAIAVGAIALISYKKSSSNGGGSGGGGTCTNPAGFENCGLNVIEKYLDPSITAPSNQLVLSSFSKDNAMGSYPWCTPTWYALRFVRLSDGGASELGPWTDLPVIAGNTNFPGRSYSNTCGFNKPFLGTEDDLLYHYDNSDPNLRIFANVHRQEGQFDPMSEGTIVGMLIPSSSNGVRWQFLDIKNPNDIKSKCVNC